PGGAKVRSAAPVGRSVVLALVTFIIGYAVVAAFYSLLKVDLRYWFMALKPMGPGQLHIFVAYLIPFAVFFLVALRSMHGALGIQAHSARVQYLVNIVA